MEQPPSCLHPNPGWGVREAEELSNSTITSSKSNIVGKHCILELYECDRLKLNDESFVRTTITTAAKLAGAHLLNLITHKFDPQGVTGLALLAESHISVHTWPENGYAAIDVFTCGDQTVPDRACEIFRQEFHAQRFSLKSFQRETPDDLSTQLRIPTGSKSKGLKS